MSEPKLDMAQLERIVRMNQAIPAKLQVSPTAMAKLTGRPDVAILHLDIPIEANPWLGAGQWLTLNRDEQVIAINGQHVDPGPNIFTSALMHGEWVLPDVDQAELARSWYGPRRGRA